jgi:hypothetical protein
MGYNSGLIRGSPLLTGDNSGLIRGSPLF